MKGCKFVVVVVEMYSGTSISGIFFSFQTIMFLHSLKVEAVIRSESDGVILGVC